MGVARRGTTGGKTCTGSLIKKNLRTARLERQVLGASAMRRLQKVVGAARSIA
jgi:hypothetical protein